MRRQAHRCELQEITECERQAESQNLPEVQGDPESKGKGSGKGGKKGKMHELAEGEVAEEEEGEWQAQEWVVGQWCSSVCFVRELLPELQVQGWKDRCWQRGILRS